MAGTAPQIEWYIARDGSQHGPLADVEMRKFVELGHLRPQDLVWRAGFPDWRPGAQVFPELADPRRNAAQAAPVSDPASGQRAPANSGTTSPLAGAPSAGALASDAGSGDPRRSADVGRERAIAAESAAARDPKSTGATPRAQQTTANAPGGQPASPTVTMPTGSIDPGQRNPMSAGPRDHQLSDFRPSQDRAGHQTGPTNVAAQAGAQGRDRITDRNPAQGAQPAWQTNDAPGARGPVDASVAKSPTTAASPSLWRSIAQQPADATSAPTSGAAAYRNMAPAGPGQSSPQIRLQDLGTADVRPGGQRDRDGRDGGDTPRGDPSFTASREPKAASPSKSLIASKALKPFAGRAPASRPEAPSNPTGPGSQSPALAGAPGPMLSGPMQSDAGYAGPTHRGPMQTAPRNEQAKASPPRRGFVRTAAFASGVLIVMGAGWIGWQNRSALPGMSAIGGVMLARLSAQPSAEIYQSAPFVAEGDTRDDIDRGLQKTALWRLLKRDYGDWYTERLGDIERMRSQKADEKAISKFLADVVVVQRRKTATIALAGSQDHLRQMATAFLVNLKQLSARDAQSCFGFISFGEASAYMLELSKTSTFAEPLQRQLTAIFESVADGRKQPKFYAATRRTDYDVLTAELTLRGWTQDDLLTFSDARRLSGSPPDKVCRMVQDWFTVQLSLQDAELQGRLLAESLKPLVQG